MKTATDFWRTEKTSLHTWTGWCTSHHWALCRASASWKCSVSKPSLVDSVQ